MKPTDALPHPADWSTATISKTVEIKRGISWSKEQEHLAPREGAIPVIRIGNVQERLELDDLIYISGLKPKAVDKKRVAAGWAIIVASNGNRQRIGNAVKIVDDTDFLFASFLIAAKPKADSGITPEFFYRWLSSEQVQAYLSASSEGSTGLSNLSHSFFEAMAIPYPTKDEQAAIARILDAADTAIERAREAVERARQLRKNLIAELLSFGVDTNGKFRDSIRAAKQIARTPLGLLPIKWRLSTVGAEFDLQNGFTLNENRRPRYLKRRYLRVANVQRDALMLDDIQELEASDAQFAPRVLEVNDLLVVEGHADRMQIGRCAKVTEEAQGLTFQNHLFRLRTSGDVLPYFGCLWLNSTHAQRYWNARCATSSGLNTINQRMLKRLIVPVPPKHEQQIIADVVSAQRTHLETLVAKWQSLESLKKSLMHDLLTGKVRVSDGCLSPPP